MKNNHFSQKPPRNLLHDKFFSQRHLIKTYNSINFIKLPWNPKKTIFLTYILTWIALLTWEGASYHFKSESITSLLQATGGWASDNLHMQGFITNNFTAIPISLFSGAINFFYNNCSCASRGRGEIDIEQPTEKSRLPINNVKKYVSI